MKTYDCDLHLHGKYARGVSKDMTIGRICEQAKLKGLKVVGSADILHREWLDSVKSELVEKESGVFRHKKHRTAVILSNEIQTNDRVHHVLFYPDFDSVERHREAMLKVCNHLDVDGRPKVQINSEELARSAEKVGAMIGAAHAFTPYFGLYGKYDSLAACYGEMTDYIRFVELGLSADSYFADKIPELRRYVFLSNSDCHSPWPHRLGREFNRIRMAVASFDELRKALENKDGRGIIMNAGFDPREGKYHASGCNRCFQVFSSAQREEYSRRCPICGGRIKKGVRDRIEELGGAGGVVPCEPDGPSATSSRLLSQDSGVRRSAVNEIKRPKYVHVIPLAEIIAKTIGIKSVTAGSVQSVWKRFVGAFGSEIRVLIDAPIDELEDVNAAVARSIEMFRRGETLMLVGRGGRYGELVVPKDEADSEAQRRQRISEIEGYYVVRDRKLSEFF